MKEKIQIIEKAVLQWYNIAKEELYSLRETYPMSGARGMFTYLLYKNGVEVEDIRQLMGYDAARTVYYKINSVQSNISHNHGRYPIDVQEIEKIIESLNN
jgi:chromosomal replication initiation ATPase DnaA